MNSACDQAADASTGEHAATVEGRDATKTRSWQTNIPSVISLGCGLLSLALLIVVTQSEERQLLHGSTVLFESLALAGLGVSAVLFGLVGIIVSRDFWFRLLAIAGGFAGFLPGGLGLITLLFRTAMPKHI